MFGLVGGKLLTGPKWIELRVGHCMSASCDKWPAQTVRLPRRGRQNLEPFFREEGLPGQY